jgi:preprotein translocase SecE subunit
MGLRKFTGEVVKEGKRVRWPKRDIFIPTLITVIVIAGFAALVLSFEDWATGSILKAIRDVFSSLVVLL